MGAGTWRRASIPLNALRGSVGEIGGLQIQSLSRDPLPTLYLADVRFVGREMPVARAGGE